MSPAATSCADPYPRSRSSCASLSFGSIASSGISTWASGSASSPPLTVVPHRRRRAQGERSVASGPAPIPPGRLRPGAVPEEDGAVGEVAIVEQPEAGPHLGLGQPALAGPDDDGHQEELELVDEPRRHGLTRELGAADPDVIARARLQRADRVSVEGPLDPGPCGRRGGERPREDDLVGGLPDRREVPHDRRL